MHFFLVWCNWCNYVQSDAREDDLRMPKINSKIRETSAYPERESKTLELKSRLPEFRTLAKTCIAFANCSGGEIVIGVEDGSRKIIGVSDNDRDRLYFAPLNY